MKKLQASIAFFFCMTAWSSAQAASSAEPFRLKMEKWVETRQLISEERADWAADKQILRATRDLLQQDANALAAEVAELEATSTQADDERVALLLERGEFHREARLLQSKIRGFEEDLLRVVPQLPPPLAKKLEILLIQIPENADETRVPLGQRLMNVLGVLSQTDKFNSTATFVGETRSVDGGPKVQVRTLYWGLGQAFFVDGQGALGGVGRPTLEGWVFSVDPEFAAQTRKLLDIYEGNVDVIEFVELPVSIE